MELISGGTKNWLFVDGILGDQRKLTGYGTKIRFSNE